MNQRDRLLDVLDRKNVDRVPAASPVQTATYDLMKASGISFPQAHQDPGAMAALSRAAHTHGLLEGVRVPFESAVDRGAFQEANSRLTELTADIIDRVEIPDPLVHGRAPVVLKAVAILREQVRDEVPILVGAAAPFTLACQLLGEEKAMMALVLDPGDLKAVIERAEEWALRYSSSIIEAGADVVVPLDPTATGDLIGPEAYRGFALPPQQRVARSIRDRGGRSIMHICGQTGPNLHLMAMSGMNAINVDQVMDLREVRRAVGEGMAIVGNVSPVTTLRKGTPEEVLRESLRCIEEGVDVLCPGCGFSPETPLENMRALAQAVQRK